MTAYRQISIIDKLIHIREKQLNEFLLKNTKSYKIHDV